MSSSLARVWLLALAAGTSDPHLPEWVQVPTPAPSSRAWWCANYSDSWHLTYSRGRLSAIVGTQRRLEEPLPFSIAPVQDRQGDRRVVPIGSGWLVGFDAGEFGGGLWWYPTAGSAGVRVRPSGDPPTSPRGYYGTENVRGFARVGGELVVLIGMDHMGVRSGAVFRVLTPGPDVTLALWTVLDASPSAWVVDGSSLLVLTDSTVYRLLSPGSTAVVHGLASAASGLYPTSIVHAQDGRLYIGLRRYVVRLSPLRNGAYRESWWVPRRCLQFGRVDDCECILRG